MSDPTAFTADMRAAEERASAFMIEGIRLMHSGGDIDAALWNFDCALELRQQLPIALPIHAYGLAACWLNRAEALTSRDSADHPLALAAYAEALLLLRTLPLSDDVRYSKRLAIACQNHALLLASQEPTGTGEAIVLLIEAAGVLERAESMEALERKYLLAVVWMNLANLQAAEDTVPSDLRAQQSARRALSLAKPQEHAHPAPAEAGLSARHVLCRIAARRLSDAKQNGVLLEQVHEATDLAEEGLNLVLEWKQRGVNRFQDLAADFFQFGARVYERYQPQFLDEFVNEIDRHEYQTVSGVEH